MLRLKLVFALLVVSAMKWRPRNPARVLYPMFIGLDIGHLLALFSASSIRQRRGRRCSAREIGCWARQCAPLWAAGGNCQTRFQSAGLVYLRSSLRRAVFVLASGVVSCPSRRHSGRGRPQVQSVAHPIRYRFSLVTPTKLIDLAVKDQFSQGQPRDECSK